MYGLIRYYSIHKYGQFLWRNVFLSDYKLEKICFRSFHMTNFPRLDLIFCFSTTQPIHHLCSEHRIAMSNSGLLKCDRMLWISKQNSLLCSALKIVWWFIIIVFGYVRLYSRVSNILFSHQQLPCWLYSDHFVTQLYVKPIRHIMLWRIGKTDIAS